MLYVKNMMRFAKILIVLLGIIPLSAFSAVDAAIQQPLTPRRNRGEPQLINPNKKPWSAYGQLQMEIGGRHFIGSATLISDCMLLTAAHNLFNRPTKGIASKVSFLVRHGDTIYWYAEAAEWHIHPTYIEASTEKEADQYDIAVVFLNVRLGHEKAAGCFKWKPISDVLPSSLRIVGYPAYIVDSQQRYSLTSGKYLYMVEGASDSIQSTSFNIYYFINTFHGHSGAIISDTTDGSYGVHTNGNSMAHKYYGTRFAESIVSWIKARERKFIDSPFIRN